MKILFILSVLLSLGASIGPIDVSDPDLSEC